MKYIRTKDGIRRVFRKLKNGFYLVKVSKYKYYHYYPDCEVADTIERLCDEFVVVWKGNKANPYKFTQLEWVEFAKAKYMETNGKNDVESIYGAIWTDKGLIYVAKMKGVLPNGEIEWELL